MKSIWTTILATAVAVFAAWPALGGVVVRPSASSQANGRWAVRTVSLTVSSSLLQSTAVKSGSDVREAFESAAAEWESAAGVRIDFIWSDAPAIGQASARLDGRNVVTASAIPENLMMFSGEEQGSPAKTRLFINRRGKIVESDIILNPYLLFSTDGTPGSFDLQSVITHELGHLLGLGHSPVIGATMHGYLLRNDGTEGSALLARTLTSDDLHAAGELYGFPSGENRTLVRVTLSGVATEARFAAWLEEESSGRVVAGKFLQGGESVSFSGVRPGKYVVRVDETGSSTRQWSVWERTVVVNRRTPQMEIAAELVRSKETRQSIAALGDGTASPVAIGIMGMQRFDGFLVSSGSPDERAQVGSTSPLLSMTTTFSGVGRDSGSVYGFAAFNDGFLPFGEYTVVLRDSRGIPSFLIGAVSSDPVFKSFRRPTSR